MKLRTPHRRPLLRSRLVALPALCLLLAGCATQQPKPQGPEVELPAAWSTATPYPAENQQAWWKNFNDPQLDALIAEALRTNNELAAAAIRVRRAQLQAGLTDTNRTPSVSIAANTSASRDLNTGVTSRSSGMTSSLSYELDLWGKLASQRDAAAWETQATQADCQATALTLVGTTATLYWQLASLNQQISISEANVAYAEKTLALVRVKYAAGAVSGLDIAQAEQNLSSQQAAHTQLLQQRTETRHALAILLNQPPQSTVAERPRLPDEPLPAVAAGLPADILAHRPDLHAAETRLRESLANVDVTRTRFYPTLTLTGSLGTASDALLRLMQNPLTTLGAGLALPFIQWNTMQLNVKVSQTQYEEAAVNFRQRLYTALAEVEDTLSARTQLLAGEEKLALSLTQAQRAESFAGARFRAGATGVQRWLDAQQVLRNAENALTLNRFRQFSNHAKLYQALGGDGELDRVSCGKS